MLTLSYRSNYITIKVKTKIHGKFINGDIVLIKYQIDTTNIAYSTYIILKLTLLASPTFLVRGHRKHMVSISIHSASIEYPYQKGIHQ